MSAAERLGRLLALMALAIQLAATSFVLPVRMVEAAAVDRLVAVSICHGDHGTDGAPHRQHHPVCAVCLLCQAVSQAGALLAPTLPPLVAPVATRLPPALPPPARAPPAHPLDAAFPRGPPQPV